MESDGDDLVELLITGDVGDRSSPCCWKRRTGHQGYVHLFRGIVDELGVFPIVCDVFVDKYRDLSIAFFKNSEDFFPEPSFWVDRVSGCGFRIFAVFSDQHYPVHCQPIRPQFQSTSDGRINWKPVFLG